MTLDIIRHRLHNQYLSQTKCTQPSEVVEWLGAVQSQDYAGAKWALGQRLENATDGGIEKAFNEGAILRTHVMRPTWHFVTPADIRWMLALTAPRVLALLAYTDRQLGLDKAVFKQSNRVLTKALKGGKQLMRTELEAILQKNGVNTEGLRFIHLLMHAELDGVVCSGGRQGKQFTYALLEERAPQAKTLEREAALAELTRRYFRSHAPATLQDFVWWSGLTMADARKGMEIVKSEFKQEIVGDQTYWFQASAPAKNPSPTAHLLPNYDEYIVGYTDRSAIFDMTHTEKLDARGNVLFQNTVAIDGQIAGTWKRTLKKGEVIVEFSPFAPLKKSENQAVRAAAQQYGRFLELPVVLA
ncbi:MAG TPA: winged helix DNA-binding domain-containing protein [Anaerolineales bacterium]|nr:winged helix DNA-binding domain-containing protein [Anaerolineales bacterium]